MISAVVGINWGDEGKGRMVDLFAKDYEIICRYQGGNNAGHTVINHKGKFILNLLPSGILEENTINVLGPGMVIDIEHLCNEIESLVSQGIKITPANLKISAHAFICMPYHRTQDILEEERLKDKQYGSTRRGIAPVYGDKYMKKGIRVGELLDLETLKIRLIDIVEWKNLTLKAYNNADPINVDDMTHYLEKFGTQLRPYITDVSELLLDEIRADRKILLEAQLGALRDIEYGIYPYTTSSHTIAAYAPIGVGIPGVKLDNVIGITKAYSSCVGEGPFVVEMAGKEAEALREAGAEYGASTGRPRRVGAFDIPASLYGVEVQGATELALTKLDVLSYLDKIPVCIAYEVDGVQTTRFPTGEALNRAKPVYTYLEGFKTDISKCRHINDLPETAINYIRFIEKSLYCKITYVSVGADREDYITLR